MSEQKRDIFMLEHKGTVMLETERLILRRFESADDKAMYGNWCADLDVTKSGHQKAYR